MLPEELTWPRILIAGDIAMYIGNAEVLLQILARTTKKAVADGFWADASLFGEKDVARVTRIWFEGREGLMGRNRSRPSGGA